MRDFIINEIAASYVIPRHLRYAIYKAYGIKTKTSNIFPKCYMGGNKIIIGKGTFINNGCFLDNSETIHIGDNCQIGMEVLLCTASHHIGNENMRGGISNNKSIVIEDGCWLGARVTVLPGVKVQRGCVIAAGSIVTTDCQANGLYAGIPARRIRELN